MSRFLLMYYIVGSLLCENLLVLVLAEDVPEPDPTDDPFNTFSEKLAMLAKNEGSEKGVLLKSNEFQPLSLDQTKLQVDALELEGTKEKVELDGGHHVHEAGAAPEGRPPSDHDQLLDQTNKNSVGAHPGAETSVFGHVDTHDETNVGGNVAVIGSTVDHHEDLNYEQLNGVDTRKGGVDEDEDEEEEKDWYYDPSNDVGNQGDDRDEFNAGDESNKLKSSEEHMDIFSNDNFDDKDDRMDGVLAELLHKTNGKESDTGFGDGEAGMDDQDYHNGLVDGMVSSDDDEELVKKSKPPTAPTNMVLFYTWMILAILITVIVVSTYQARCKGLLGGGRQQMRPGEDRKRLLDNEFV